MGNASKDCLVCLSEFTEPQLDIAINQLHQGGNGIEIWGFHSSQSLKKYAAEKKFYYRDLSYSKEIAFLIPDQDFKILLPEAFSLPGNIYFLLNAELSSDNYLKGCIYSLSKLVSYEQFIEPGFPKLLFEVYLFFRENTFLVFCKKDTLLRGKAWDLDSFLVERFSLKKNRLMRLFYLNLLPPANNTFKVVEPIELQTSNLALYNLADTIGLFSKKISSSLNKLITAFSILFMMIYNKSKKRFSK